MNVRDRLEASPRLAGALFAAATLAVVLVFTQLVLPGTSGGGRGTPAAILFQGLVSGLLTALLAAGLILVYRVSRVINFAQTALGAAGGELTFQLMLQSGVPFAVAFVLGVVLAGLVGLAFELVLIRRFFRSPRLVVTVVTIAIALFISQAGRQLVQNLPFFPQELSLEDTFGTEPVRGLLPFPGFTFRVGDFNVRFGFPEVLAIEVSLLALLLLGAFLRYTRAGIAIRAVAENNERASLLGISVGSLSTIVWTITGVLGGLGVILTGALSTPGAASGIAPTILLPALAAAVVARMESITVATFVAVVIAIVTRAASFSYSEDTGLINVGLLVVIGVALLLQRRTLLRSEEGAGVTFEATDEQRPVPKELRGIPSVRITRYAVVAALLAVTIAYPFLFSTGLTVLGAVILLNGIVALSVVVLTGWAGQVSLGQFGLAAIGGVVAAGLTGKADLPFWVAVPLASAVAAGVAALIGLPALRIKGLFLGVTTFAFAIAAHATLFNRKYFDWLLPDEVERPSLFFLDFEDETSMYFLCLTAFVLAVTLVLNLRRSRFGRILIAIRENEANLQSFGVNAVRTKIMAFAASGALAGFAGAVFVHQQRGISEGSFIPQRSIDVFLLAVLGGVTSVSGALLGSLYFNLSTYFFPGNFVYESLKPIAVALILWVEPGGLIAVVNNIRDTVLRIIAQRRQIIVPSLFADVDPEALARRKIPLAEPLSAGGLAALPPTARYARESELYAGPGQRIDERIAPAVETKEAVAIGAAAESAAVPEAVGETRR